MIQFAGATRADQKSTKIIILGGSPTNLTARFGAQNGTMQGRSTRTETDSLRDFTSVLIQVDHPWDRSLVAPGPPKCKVHGNRAFLRQKHVFPPPGDRVDVRCFCGSRRASVYGYQKAAHTGIGPLFQHTRSHLGADMGANFEKGPHA